MTPEECLRRARGDFQITCPNCKTRFDVTGDDFTRVEPPIRSSALGIPTTWRTVKDVWCACGLRLTVPGRMICGARSPEPAGGNAGADAGGDGGGT
jgi:hypothetical protein